MDTSIFKYGELPQFKKFTPESISKQFPVVLEKITEEFKNIEKNLLPYSWLPKIFADIMKLNKINGTIINIGSIYGVVGQNLNYYNNTKMKENMPYSIIKGGLISLTRQMASFYGRFSGKFIQYFKPHFRSIK